MPAIVKQEKYARRVHIVLSMKLLAAVVIAAALINSTHIIASYWSIHPSGSNWGLWMVLPLVIPAILSLCVAITAIICLAFQRLRKYALAALAYSLVWYGTVILCARTGDAIRMQAFLELSERSTPIIDAIRTYEAKNGIPPNNLEQLVPDYLPNIPITGIKAYPTYELYVPKSPHEIDGNPWMLSVLTPEAGINFDMLMYLPKENYPENGYGGWLERVGHWAYVHE